jgi:hypothetical protein
MYLIAGIIATFIVILILSFLKDIFLEWDLNSSLTKVYSHLYDIITIIKENDSEVPLIVYCKNNDLDINDIYTVLNVSNFAEAKTLLSSTFLGQILRWIKRTNNVMNMSNEFRKILSSKISNKKLREFAIIEQIYLDSINKAINEENQNKDNENQESKEQGGENENKS